MSNFTILDGDYHIDGTLTANRFDIPFKDSFRWRAEVFDESLEVADFDVINFFVMDCTSGNRTVTLPLSVAGCSQAFWVNKIAGENNLIVETQGGELINRDGTQCIIERLNTTLGFLSIGNGLSDWIIF